MTTPASPPPSSSDSPDSPDAVDALLGRRRSGILLHPTSLPGPHGSGDFGPSAYHFVDWLVHAGQSLWQVLPLQPIGAGDSPYASVSAFAGNPLLVAQEPLVERGWLAPATPDALAAFDAGAVRYEAVIDWRMARLRAAWAGFQAGADAADRAALARYRDAERDWLDDYALFMVIDAQQRGDAATQAATDNDTGGGWTTWPAPLRDRDPHALAALRAAQADALGFWGFVQWCFDTQWQAVRAYAAARGIALVGDLPIFVAHHSADCWARPDLYWLDAQGVPTVVAGVPPDAFSADGQRWGNPLYRWERFAAEDYAWWIARVRRQFALADIVRIDHFRGFAAYWAIPADCPHATGGRWVDGPGAALFAAIRAALGPLPVIAEDLGVITPDVEALRRSGGFPGMKVLQFAFGAGADHPFLPHNHAPDSVAYVGTHDNDTVHGWWHVSASAREREHARQYLRCDGHDAHRAMWRALLASPARTVVMSMQDALGLDGRHRMNTPGRARGCWRWRLQWQDVPPQLAAELAVESALFGRGDFARVPLPSA